MVGQPDSDLDLLARCLDDQSEDAPEILGLFLTPGLKPSGYDATPDCCRPFAWTGGDGVHFSLADAGAGFGDNSPVVMTVPMKFDMPNMILAGSLRDFLRLGLRSGYFALENLAYRRADTIAMLDRAAFAPSQSALERAMLTEIGQVFGLEPVRGHAAHLNAVSEAYGFLLE